MAPRGVGVGVNSCLVALRYDWSSEQRGGWGGGIGGTVKGWQANMLSPAFDQRVKNYQLSVRYCWPQHQSIMGNV